MGEIIERHKECINTSCGSSDAMAIYEEELESGDVEYNATCFSCETFFTHKQLAESYVGEELGITSTGGYKSGGSKRLVAKVKPKKYITDEQIQHIKTITCTDKTKYRTLVPGVNSKFKVLSEFNGNNEIIKRYYPVYDLEDKLCGYKIRVVATKDFYSTGHTGNDTALFGQHDMKKASKKYVGLFGGEEDALAAYSMLAKHQAAKGYDPIACVSPSTSETASIKNIKQNYEWLDTFEKIIIGFDDDEKGKEYAIKAAEVCPPGKAYLMAMPVAKDPCDVKIAGKDKEFVKAFYWDSVKYKPQGIVGSSELRAAVIAELEIEKIPLPPFMAKLQDMLAGGLPLGYIVNIGAASGCGKTSIINEMIYYWLFNSPHKVGVVSLELSKGQYGMAMLSRHLGKKLQLFQDTSEAKAFVNRPDNVELGETLWVDEEGDSRWYLIDEREGSVENLKNQINQLVVSCGCKVIVLDPISDITAALPLDQQADFMKYQKVLIKKGVTFVNINHVRKSGSGEKAGSQGRDLVEEDMEGSSSIFKSGGINFLVMRDKYAEDLIVRNTVRVVLSKSRSTGFTGPAGEWYYDLNTHTLHDKEEFFASNTIEDSIPYDDGSGIEDDFVKGFEDELETNTE